MHSSGADLVHAVNLCSLIHNEHSLKFVLGSYSASLLLPLCLLVGHVTLIEVDSGLVIVVDIGVSLRIANLCLAFVCGLLLHTHCGSVTQHYHLVVTFSATKLQDHDPELLSNSPPLSQYYSLLSCM